MIDIRLYALVDPECAGGLSLPDLAKRVASGGATLVQLRDKHSPTRQQIAEARTIKAALLPFGVPLIINDRVDVALAASADGVHVGQDDMPARDVRQLLGPKAIIGLSIKTLAQAEAAPLDVLDYVCIGGVFATTSKNNPDPPIGLSGLAAILNALRARAPKFPIGAIAGINETNAAQVIGEGVDGIAVISALSLAPDPTAAAGKLRQIVDRALMMQVDP